MSSQTRLHLQQEVDLIGRFADSYRRHFSVMIDRLNQNPSSVSDVAGLRLCVEAVAVMLSNQSELARVFHELANDPTNSVESLV
jgi:hypothetical protein